VQTFYVFGKIHIVGVPMLKYRR